MRFVNLLIRPGQHKRSVVKNEHSQSPTFEGYSLYAIRLYATQVILYYVQVYV